jgi:hypothetical protein
MNTRPFYNRAVRSPAWVLRTPRRLAGQDSGGEEVRTERRIKEAAGVIVCTASKTAPLRLPLLEYYKVKVVTASNTSPTLSSYPFH